VGILNEGDSIDMRSEEIYIPSAYSVEENEVEVSQGFMIFLTHGFLYVSVFLFSTRDF
jgi:hypothetical protein